MNTVKHIAIPHDSPKVYVPASPAQACAFQAWQIKSPKRTDYREEPKFIHLRVGEPYEVVQVQAHAHAYSDMAESVRHWSALVLRAKGGGFAIVHLEV